LLPLFRREARFACSDRAISNACVVIGRSQTRSSSNSEGNSITAFSVDATTGVLTTLNGSPFPATDATLITVVTSQ
jgi:hypothetical protein